MNDAENIVTTISNHDLSLLGIFFQASLTVKIVMILLIWCSFWSWTVTFAKLYTLKRLKANADKFEESFWNCGSMDIFFDNLANRSDDPFVSVFVSGMQELRRTKTKIKTVIGNMSLNDRVNKIMQVTVSREIEHLERHIGFLATVGSTAPFVGVFGTVIGILNTFESMGANTNITSVAPGIAEALFSTALGLGITIPAVVAYNKISTEINRYQNRLESFIDEFLSFVSRQNEDSEA